MSNNQSKVEKAVAAIEQDAHEHKGFSAFHHELNSLRNADGCDKAQYAKDLSQVTAQLHALGVLPKIDIVATGNGHEAFLGANSGGPSGTLTTEAHGTTFKYDKQGDITQYSTDHGKDVFKYNSQTGEYQEYVNGTKKGSAFDAAITVQNGHEVVTNPDGSTTSYRGNTQIVRNPDGHVTSIMNNGTGRQFTYDSSGNLTSMTEVKDGKTVDTYKLQTGANNPNKGLFVGDTASTKNPVIINVTDNNAVTHITNAEGVSKANGATGGVVTRDAQGHLSEIQYANGDIANHFKYAKDGNIASFEVKGRDGKLTTYTENPGGGVSVEQAGRPAHLLDGKKGTIYANSEGVISIGDNSDTANPSSKIQYNLGGAVIYSGPDGPTKIINKRGQESTYSYTNGALSAVQAYGENLKLEHGSWVNAKTGQPSSVVPSWDANHDLTFTNSAGTAVHYWPGGGSYETSPKDAAESASGPSTAGLPQPGSDGAPGAPGSPGSPGDGNPPTGNPSDLFKMLGTDFGQLKSTVEKDLQMLTPDQRKLAEADVATLAHTALSDMTAIALKDRTPKAVASDLQADEKKLVDQVQGDFATLAAASPQTAGQLVEAGAQLAGLIKSDYSQLKPVVEAGIQEFEAGAHGAAAGKSPDIFSMLGADYGKLRSTLSQDEAQLDQDASSKIKASIQRDFAQLKRDAASGSPIQLAIDLWKDSSALKAEASPKLKADLSTELGALRAELKTDFQDLEPTLKSDISDFETAQGAAASSSAKF